MAFIDQQLNQEVKGNNKITNVKTLTVHNHAIMFFHVNNIVQRQTVSKNWYVAIGKGSIFQITDCLKNIISSPYLNSKSALTLSTDYPL